MKIIYDTLIEWLGAKYARHHTIGFEGCNEIIFNLGKDNYYICVEHSFPPYQNKIKINILCEGKGSSMWFDSSMGCFDADFYISLIKKALDFLEIAY